MEAYDGCREATFPEIDSTSRCRELREVGLPSLIFNVGQRKNAVGKIKFRLTIARIVWPSDPPIIAVLLPWNHFQHELGVTAYATPISRANALPIAISVSPEKKIYSDCRGLDRVWAKACEQTPPDKLKWQEEEFEGDYAPWEALK